MANNLVELFDQYDWEKNYCICQRWGIKFECNDDYLEINCDMWSLGLDESFQCTCFGTVFFKGLQKP